MELKVEYFDFSFGSDIYVYLQDLLKEGWTLITVQDIPSEYTNYRYFIVATREKT